MQHMVSVEVATKIAFFTESLCRLKMAVLSLLYGFQQPVLPEVYILDCTAASSN